MKRKKVSEKLKLIMMPEPKAPLVHIEFALLNGSLRDPERKDGVASLTLSMLLRGTRKKDAKEFHRLLDNLGAEIHLGKYKESMRIYCVCLASKLNEFLDLVEEMLTEPAFHEAEFKKVKDQLGSALLDELGSDDEIVDRRFQEYLLWGNPYGKMTVGSLQSLKNIEIEDLRKFHHEFFRQKDFIVGASGGFQKKELAARISSILGKLREGSAGRLDAKAPVVPKGKSLLLLDKQGRSQSQIMVGAPGISFCDKDYFAILVANHVFGGGSFSARLMKEVREKRGWSYGAYSWYRSGRKPLYFAMHTIPSNKDTIPALQLMMSLFQDYAKKGIEKTEFAFAKESLVNQSAFLQDTTRKKLDNKVTEAVLQLPTGFYDTYQKKLERLTYAQVQRAIKKHMDPSRMFAVILGSVDELEKDLSQLKGFSHIWRKKFDEAPSDLRRADPFIVNGRRTARKAESKKRSRKDSG